MKNIITRAVGRKPDVDVDFFPIELDPGDSLLLCSDGIHGVLDDSEIKILTEIDAKAQITCTKLIEAANDRGGPDNSSVIYMKI